MGRVLVVATAGAGGDLQPLIAAALALRDRGHEVVFAGDRSVETTLTPLGVPTQVLPRKLDLGPRLGGAVRDAMAETGNDLAAAGPIVKERMTAWANEAAGAVGEIVLARKPDTIMTSLMGVEALALLSPSRPWAVVNSTFYMGPNPPRAVEDDFGPRAIPLMAHFASLLGSADLVLHATDREFDLGFDGLPDRNHYVGPLGIWEPPGDAPSYLAEDGDPWVLVTISSQMQDDLPLVQTATEALSGSSVRVVVTLGPDHDPEDVSVGPGVRLERTVSHSAVLEHGRLLVSHAGHGSVMKALWFGRPMVLIPWGRDQPGVAARAEALGAAVVVPRASASEGTLRPAIQRALDDAGIRAAAEHARERLRAADDPASKAAELIETL